MEMDHSVRNLIVFLLLPEAGKLASSAVRRILAGIRAVGGKLCDPALVFNVCDCVVVVHLGGVGNRLREFRASCSLSCTPDTLMPKVCCIPSVACPTVHDRVGRRPRRRPTRQDQ